MVDKIGRRPLFLTSNIGMLVTFGMWTLTTALYQTQQNRKHPDGTPWPNLAAANATIAMIPLFFLAYSIGTGVLVFCFIRELITIA